MEKCNSKFMKTELEIAYSRSKARLVETKEFLNNIRNLISQSDQISKQDVEALIRDFERKIQP